MTIYGTIMCQKTKHFFDKSRLNLKNISEQINFVEKVVKVEDEEGGSPGTSGSSAWICFCGKP